MQRPFGVHWAISKSNFRFSAHVWNDDGPPLLHTKYPSQVFNDGKKVVRLVFGHNRVSKPSSSTQLTLSSWSHCPRRRLNWKPRAHVNVSRSWPKQTWYLLEVWKSRCVRLAIYNASRKFHRRFLLSAAAFFWMEPNGAPIEATQITIGLFAIHANATMKTEMRARAAIIWNGYSVVTLNISAAWSHVGHTENTPLWTKWSTTTARRNRSIIWNKTE